ncbi:MAG: hypothetical protein GX051_07595 [Clostridiales bacterium]|nr:hypothetical protein [Clostridiales bacterium]
MVIKMKSALKKLSTILMCLCMVAVTLCPALAASAAAPVSCENDLASIERDVPVITVNGFGTSIYKGLSTPSEDDDEQIWAPSAEVIAKSVAVYGPQLAVWIATENYDAAAAVLSQALLPIFQQAACDENGVPNPDTGIKTVNDYEAKEAYGFENRYSFSYDWRLDMHTISAQLDEYIKDIMEITGSDRVVITAMSMGNCVLTTYLYEDYYTDPDYDGTVEAAMFIAGAMNGVACCGDAFSGNISIDTTSLLRFMSEKMMGSAILQAVYYALESMYAVGVLEPVANYANKLTDALIDQLMDDGFLKTLATMPGFYALMSPQEYDACRAAIFDTPEKLEHYAGLIAKNDYYHDSVQDNNVAVIRSMLSDGIRVGIFAEYGYTMAPVTSDNERLSDSVITTAAESFGATCAEVDDVLGDGYVQAVECPSGFNHISCDRQIDASTCAFPDITWFGKYMNHTDSRQLLKNLVDLVLYGDKQIDVGTYTEFPQFLASVDGSLIPLEDANPAEPTPFEQLTLVNRIKQFIQQVIMLITSLVETFK